MFHQLLAEKLPSLTKGRPNNNNTNNNNKANCIPGGTLRVLAGKNIFPPKYMQGPTLLTL
jgi:hypothetical protein